MAASDAKPFPIKGSAYRVTFPILDADGDLVTGAAGLDSEVSKDAGTFADCTNEATEIATNSGVYYLDLTATEMNADTVAVIVKTSTSGAKTTVLVLYPLESGDISGVTLADDAITASKFDESTAFPLVSADSGATAVARTGADSDTLETLSDQLDGVNVTKWCGTTLTTPGDAGWNGN